MGNVCCPKCGRKSFTVVIKTETIVGRASIFMGKEFPDAIKGRLSSEKTSYQEISCRYCSFRTTDVNDLKVLKRCKKCGSYTKEFYENKSGDIICTYCASSVLNINNWKRKSLV
jgi:DNA-directed RNA polymerase subunit RPC12/RpoP